MSIVQQGSETGESALTARVMAVIVAVFPLLVLQANRGAVIPLVLAGLLGLWECVRARRIRFDLDRPVALALAAIIVWGAVSELWAETPGLALPKATALLSLALAGLLAIRAVRALDPDRLLGAAMTGIALGAVVVMADIHTGYGLTVLLHGKDGEMSPNVLIPTRFKAGITVVAILAAMVIWAGFARRWWMRSVAVLVLAVALARTVDSLAAPLAMAVGAVAGLACALLPRLGPAAMGLVAAGVMAVAPLAYYMPSTYDLTMRFPHLPNSALHRTMIWHFTATRLVERPILGWGLESSRALPGGDDTEEIWMRFDAVRPPVSQQQQHLPLHPHNFALQVWVETGAVGAVLFAGLLLAVLRMAAARPGFSARTTPMVAFAAAMVVALVGYGIWQSWWLSSLWLIAMVARGIEARSSEHPARAVSSF